MDQYIGRRGRPRIKGTGLGTRTSSTTTSESQHALRSYWKHMSGLYFRRADEQMLDRLDHLEAIVHTAGTFHSAAGLATTEPFKFNCRWTPLSLLVD